MVSASFTEQDDNDPSNRHNSCQGKNAQSWMTKHDRDRPRQRKRLPFLTGRIVLPTGMSLELADALESKLCAWYDQQDQFAFDLGVQIFQEIAENRRS
jgi:hypothetical protein